MRHISRDEVADLEQACMAAQGHAAQLQYELTEARLEIERHHRDFAEISRLLDLASIRILNPTEKKIRNVVG